MNVETRNCQNCKNDFVIESEDFAFYEKIKVPPPTFCPSCRLRRRMSFRNERMLYKRRCSLCGDSIIAMYSNESSFPVYCNSCWWSDKWDARDFAKEVDFGRNFFEQVSDLFKNVPRSALIGSANMDSNYVNYSAWLKNCYLVVGCGNVEDSAYCYRAFTSKHIFDCFSAIDSQFCYQNKYCIKCYDTSFSEDSENCIQGYMLSSCRNSNNCLGSVNLRNAKYHILNKPVSEGEFKEKHQKLGSFKEKEDFEKEFLSLKLTQPHKYGRNVLVMDSSGDYLNQTKNCKNCFVIRESENLKYCCFGSFLKNSQDINFCDNLELCYESCNMEQNYLKLFSMTSWFSKEVTYCDTCFSSSNLFGCVGLRDKKYYILNKEYSKEEYETLIPKIIEHMNTNPYTDKKGRKFMYGEFFSSELSPFAYNETIAQEYFFLTKEEAIKEGHLWKDIEIKNYEITKKPEDIPEHIKDVDDSILKEVIGCEHKGGCNEQCTTAFKIIPQELQFYKKENLPLPRLCPNCRHYGRSHQKNPVQFWHRSCQCAGNKSETVHQNTTTHFHGAEHCPNEFETSYSPERKEIVYCESCYQAEVA